MNGVVKLRSKEEIIADFEKKKVGPVVQPKAPVVPLSTSPTDTSPLGAYVESQARMGTPPEEVAAEVGGLQEPGTARALAKFGGETGEEALTGLLLGGAGRLGINVYKGARGLQTMGQLFKGVGKTAKGWGAWTLPFGLAEEIKPGSTEPFYPLMAAMGLKYLGGKIPIKGRPPGYISAMAKHTQKLEGALAQDILKYIDPTKGAVSRIPLFPSGPKWERLEEWAGGRTVGELFGAASERAGKMAKGMLRQYRVGAGLAQTAVHKEVQPLLNPKTTSPEVIMDVARWANPKSNVDVSRLPEESLMTIAKIENAVSGLMSRTSQRKVAYDTLITTNFNRRFSNLIKFEDATLEPIRQRLAGIKTFDESYKELGKIIEDPKFSPQVRGLAEELYNLPAKLPREIYRAYTDSLYKVTTAKIKSNPNWAYATVKGEKVRVPKEGYRESNQKGMEGYIVRKDIDNALRELNYTQEHGQRFHRYLLGPWKLMKTVFSFATQMKNNYGNLMLNDTYGPHPLPWYTPEGVSTYTKAMQDLLASKPPKDLKKFADITGVDISAFMGGEVGKYHLPKTYHENVMESLVRHFYKVADMKIPGLGASAPEMYQNAEKWAKYSKYLWNKKHGMSDIAAAQDAITATFDYNDVSIFVRRMRETAFPFFTWSSKMITQLPERVVTHPLRMAKYYAIPAAITAYALQDLNLTQREFEKIKAMLPDYWRKGWFLLMPKRDEQGRLNMVNLNYLIPGLGDVAELSGSLFTDPTNLALQNPFARLAVDLTTGTNSYTGSKIAYDWEPSHVQLVKYLMYAYRQMTPSILPGNRDWQMLWDTFVEQKPEALSPGAAIMSQFGFRTLAVDPQRVQRRWIAESNERMREIEYRRKSEYRAARTAEEKRKVSKKYMKIMRSERERRMEPYRQ